jgi:hypothetical protein
MDSVAPDAGQAESGAVMDPTPYLDFEPPPLRRGDPLEEAALAFHRLNPHILQELARICLRVAHVGRKQWSINAAFEVVRYNAEITTDHRVYKLNNNHRAFYARWLMRDFQELRGFFQTREVGRVEQNYDE